MIEHLSSLQTHKSMASDELLTPAGRPRRRTTLHVDYREKKETDIPLVRSRKKDIKKEGKRETKREVKREPKTKRTGYGASMRGKVKKRAAHARGTHARTGHSPSPPYISVDEMVPMNWQPPQPAFNYVPDLNGAVVQGNTLRFADGVEIHKGDCIYMICEPPTEPFYLAMVTGFVKTDRKHTRSTECRGRMGRHLGGGCAGSADGAGSSASANSAGAGAVEKISRASVAALPASDFMFEVLWFYRPHDIMRRSTDSRYVYASVHKDLCPVQSFRGFAQINHSSQIDDLRAYKQRSNTFYFEKLYDRYTMKTYDMIATKDMTNLPPNYYKALQKRFSFIFVENGHGAHLQAAPHNCERCRQWCPPAESICCFKCGKCYHLVCVEPPLTSRPKRGFAWYCASCSGSERAAHDEIDDTDAQPARSPSPSAQPSPPSTTASYHPPPTPLYEKLAAQFLAHDQCTLKQRRDMEEWPWRYLGVHARLEDALDPQDRPFPRASSRLGARYQCTGIPEWYGHRVVYYDDRAAAARARTRRRPVQKSRLSMKSRRARSHSPAPLKPEQEDPLARKKMPVPAQFASADPARYPGWLQPRPRGYIERGGKETATLMWEEGDEATEGSTDSTAFLTSCADRAAQLGIDAFRANFIDACLKCLLDCKYDPVAARSKVSQLTLADLKEPDFSAEEVHRFEESVRAHGGDLRAAQRAVKSQPITAIVRFYYLWKKTPSGRAIWDNYPQRPKNRFKYMKAIQLDLDDPADDARYSDSKIRACGAQFECAYCGTGHSRHWYRAPGVCLPKTAEQLCHGLCERCCRLWRRYSVVWCSPDAMAKRAAQKGGGWRARLEAALREDCDAILAARENYSRHPRRANAANLRLLREQKNTLEGDSRRRKRVEDGRGKTRKVKRVKREGSEASEESASDATETQVTNTESDTTVSTPTKNASAPEPASTPSGVPVSVTTPSAASRRRRKPRRKMPDDPLLAQMRSRYTSKFDVFDPFSGQPASELDIPQERSAMRDIGALWRSSVTSRRRAVRAAQGNRAGNRGASATPSHPLLFDPAVRPCCVCRKPGGLDETLICSNCGLNVHASCYGVQLPPGGLPRPPYTYRWHCDACSNDIHPLVSTHYTCSLCNACESNHDGAIHGSPDSAPDALKRTSAGLWCHVQCAAFCDGATFGDPRTLQPVYGARLASFRNISRRCALCGGYAGALISCRACGRAMHVTCCQDTPGFFLGFVLEPADAARCVTVVHNGAQGRPAPVALCADHFKGPARDSYQGQALYTMRAQVIPAQAESAHPIPLLQAFCALEKSGTDQPHGGILMHEVFAEMQAAGTSDAELSALPTNLNASQIDAHISPAQSSSAQSPRTHAHAHTCARCHTTESIRWHQSKNAYLCHSCHIITTAPQPPDVSRLNLPIDGTKFGIGSLNDRAGQQKRTRISIRDMLI